MKITIVARHYWPKPGAATVRLQTLVRELVRRGHRVSVITSSIPDRELREGEMGEQVFGVRGDSGTGFGLKRVIQLVLFSLQVGTKLRTLAPDVVVSDPPPTSGIASLSARSATHVYYIADAWAQMLREGGGRSARIASRAVVPLENYVLRKSDLVISVRENLSLMARNAGAKEVITSPYGTNVSIFRPDGLDWADPWAAEKPYFLYAGNYGVVQGGTVFLRAAETLWADGLDFGMVYMGYGSDEETVATFAERYPKLCFGYPLLPPEIAAAAYRGAVAGLASMRPVAVASETRPAKALAALACGCPVLFAGDSFFRNEIEANELGLAVPWEQVAVADALRSLVLIGAKSTGERQHRARIAEYARKNYDMSSAVSTLAERIESVHVARMTQSKRIGVA